MIIYYILCIYIIICMTIWLYDYRYYLYIYIYIWKIMISDATPPNPMAPQNLRSLTAAIRPNVRIILCPGHENPIYRWMRTGVAPIPGNLQMLWKCNNPLKSRCSRKYSIILLLETAIMFWWKPHVFEWWNQGMVESSLLRGSLRLFDIA